MTNVRNDTNTEQTEQNRLSCIELDVTECVYLYFQLTTNTRSDDVHELFMCIYWRVLARIHRSNEHAFLI